METENLPVLIKPCTISDLDGLVFISRTTYYDTFIDSNSSEDMELYLETNMSSTVLSKELSNPDSFFYFATCNNQTIGYLKINRGPAQIESFNVNTVELERLYILKDFLGKGAASHLLKIAIDFAINESAEFLWLGVWEQNYRARRFYEKNGFIKFGEHNFVMGKDI